MKYALNLDAETKRILSATFPQYAPDDAVTVDTLPDGNIADFLYIDSEYIYSPRTGSETADDIAFSKEQSPQDAVYEQMAEAYREGVQNA